MIPILPHARETPSGVRPVRVRPRRCGRRANPLRLFLGRGGIQNLTDEFYVNHLDSLNPFTGHRIAEVGRTAYVGIELGF